MRRGRISIGNPAPSSFPLLGFVVRKTIKNMLAEYGAIAAVIYLVIFFLVLVGFWAAIRVGWQPASTAGSVGTWTAAYIATKLTQPLRILATLAITPVMARVYDRVTGKGGERLDRPSPN